MIPGDSPQCYTFVAEVDAGLGGCLRGETNVVLGDEGERTLLNYDANVELSGWLSGFELSFLKSTAKRYMHRFIDELVVISQNPQQIKADV